MTEETATLYAVHRTKPEQFITRVRDQAHAQAEVDRMILAEIWPEGHTAELRLDSGYFCQLDQATGKWSRAS